MEALGTGPGVADVADVTAVPLVIGRGGVESDLGTLVLRWADGRSPSDEERELDRIAGRPWQPLPPTARDTRRTPPSGPSGSSAWRTPTP